MSSSRTQRSEAGEARTRNPSVLSQARSTEQLGSHLFVFNIPPTAKVILRWGHCLVSSDRLLKPGIEPAIPGLHGEWFIDYTTAALTTHGLVQK